MIGPSILVPIAIVAVVVVGTLLWYRAWRAGRDGDSAGAVAPDGRVLTAKALRDALPAGWRVVHEVPFDALGGPDQVLVGPGGVFALTTSFGPAPDTGRSTAELAADAAMRRGPLDELLRVTGEATTATVDVRWGPQGDPHEVAHRYLVVPGAALADWLADLDAAEPVITPDRVTEVWRAVVVGIGRPDPVSP